MAQGARRVLHLRPGRGLVLIFLFTIVLPAIALGVIAARGLVTERQSAQQQVIARVDKTAARIADGIDEQLRTWQADVLAAADAGAKDPALLPTWFRRVADDGSATAALLIERAGVFTVWPERAVAYVPSMPLLPVRELSQALLEAEQAELNRDYGLAIRLYRTQRLFAAPGDRPWIEQRLARTFRKAGQWREALQMYEALAHLAGHQIEGLPADLIARVEICAILAAENPDRLQPAARDLYRDLVAGRWLLEKTRYLGYADMARGWIAATDAEVAALAATDGRKRALADALASQKLEGFLIVSSRPSGSGNVSVVAALSRSWLQTTGWKTLAGQPIDDDLMATIDPAAGTLIKSSLFPSRVNVRLKDPAATWAELNRSRNLYVAVLASALALLTFGGFAASRVIRRELEVARMKSDFVSAVSHEFRSPLTGIRQLGEMLMNDRVPSEDRRREYYARITRESDRLARVVENVLDFARMEEGKRPFAFGPIDTSRWLQDLVTTFDAHAASNGHVLVTGIPDDLPALTADRDALTTAVDNLLDNAVKYSPDAKTVWIDAEASADRLTIRVRDAGVGIAPEDHTRVFDRFVRAGGELTRQVKGTGLGLSLVSHIVRAHGGEVSVQSVPGAGSTFILQVPLRPS